MSGKTITVIVLAVIAFIVALLQRTSYAFLTPSQTDFVGGLTIGLGIGAVMAWFAEKPG